MLKCYTHTTETWRWTGTGRLTVFTCWSSRHSGVVHWIVCCNLLRNQGHYCIIRHLKNSHTVQMSAQSKPEKPFVYILCFHLGASLTQPIQNPIDHCMSVIFYISLHLLCFHMGRQRISYYPYVLYSAPVHPNTCIWSLTAKCLCRPVLAGISHSLYSIIPFLYGWGVCACTCV